MKQTGSKYSDKLTWLCDTILFFHSTAFPPRRPRLLSIDPNPTQW